MLRILRTLRTATFLGWIAGVLAATTIGLAVWSLQLAATVAVTGAKAATATAALAQLRKKTTKDRDALTARHRKEIAGAVAKTKAKARLRRLAVAVPVVGVVLTGYFEEQDYRTWKEENPDGTRNDYACEVARLSAEVIDEVLQELPEAVRPDESTVMGWVPKCLVDELDQKPRQER